MSFALYIIGLLLLLGGIGWGLSAVGASTTVIAIACLIVAGIGVMSAASRTRSKDRP